MLGDHTPDDVQKAFYEALTENLTVKFSTPTESLVQDPETKTILGIVAGGKTYKANKGVIMCTGGFESDPDMLYNFTGVTGCVPYAGKANTGDSHRACAAVGAGFWHMYGGAQYWTALRNLDNTEFLSTVWNFTKKNLGITVGVSERRFYMDYDACSCPTGPYAEPGSDIHLNMGYRHGITNFGGTWNHLPLPEVTWFIFDADAMANGEIFTDVTTDPVGDGWVLEANSIEELAGKIEVPAEELVATVTQWNEFCDRGADMAFYRPADTLTPIKTGPFYAMRCVPAMLNTDGGPRATPRVRFSIRSASPFRTYTQPANSAACGGASTRAPATWASAPPLAASPPAARSRTNSAQQPAGVLTGGTPAET